MMTSGRDPRVVWLQTDGTPVACQEKLKVLNENLIELRQVAQDAFEDALLIGCDEAQVRAVLQALVHSLTNPWSRRDGGSPARD
jgi:hypothetical protein